MPEVFYHSHHVLIVRGHRVKVVRAVLAPRPMRERKPRPEGVIAPSLQPTAEDCARILRDRVDFPKLLWGEVI